MILLVFLKSLFITLLSFVTILYFNDFRLLMILYVFLIIEYIFDVVTLIMSKS